MMAHQEVARLMRDAVARHDAADQRLCSGDSDADRRAASEEMTWTLAEIDALTDLALATRPASLADATVTTAVLLNRLGIVNTFEVESQVRTGELQQELARIERVIAAVLLTMMRATGLPWDALPNPDIRRRIVALVVPGEVVAG